MCRLATVLNNGQVLGRVLVSHNTTTQVITQTKDECWDFCGDNIQIYDGHIYQLKYEGGETITIKIIEISHPIISQTSAKFVRLSE